MRFNRRHILILILVVVIISVFLPIHIRYSFIAAAKVYPLKEWKFSKGIDEGYWSQQYNYETDAMSDMRNYRFERGDIAELEIREDLQNVGQIIEGDTLAVIKSFFIENEITRLKNLREIERANLVVVSTGEKQSLVEQAQRQYDYALQEYDLQKKNFARQQSLFQDSVITAQEYDLAENALKLAEINTQVTLNALTSFQSGQKAPMVYMSEETINAYEKEIERLEAQMSRYTIVSPLAGIFAYDPVLEGVIKVSDNSRLVLKIPVPYQNSAYLSDLHSVKFSTPDNKITVGVSFKGFDEAVSLIQNKQFVIGRAVTEEYTSGIYPGMVVRCRIYCDKVSILEYLKRKFMLSF